MRVVMVLDTVWGDLDIRADYAEICDGDDYCLIDYSADEIDDADGVLGVIERAATMANRRGETLYVDFRFQGRLIARIEVKGVEE